MAAPTIPTKTTIATEGLKKAGYGVPATQPGTTRAETEFLDEVRHDLWTACKPLRSMMTVAVMVTANGKDRYPQPTDYSHGMTLSRLDGSVSGTAQSGSVNNIRLAASDTMVEGDAIGKNVLIYAGTGAGSMSQITSFDTTLKDAGVTPNFTTAPDETSSYIIIIDYFPMKRELIEKRAELRQPTLQGAPESFYEVGDADNGEFILYPVPYRPNGVPWGMQQRYYADLTRLDLAGTLMTTVLRRFRTLFVTGVTWKQLLTDNDNRAGAVKGEYDRILMAIRMREEHGMEMGELQMSVKDYE